MSIRFGTMVHSAHEIIHNISYAIIISLILMHVFDTLRPEHKWVFFQWNLCILIQNLLRFVPQGPIDNMMSALSQFIVWCHIMTLSNGSVSRVTVPLRGIQRSPVIPLTKDSPHKGTASRTSDVSLLIVWTNYRIDIRLTGNSRRHLGHLASP